MNMDICGYCYENPCVCDGFGNDPVTGLPLDFSKGLPDRLIAPLANEESEEAALYYADGTPVEEGHRRQPISPELQARRDARHSARPRRP